MDPEFVVTALSVQMPPVLRWAGAIAKRLRNYNIGLTGKSSGSASTDALTIADLTVQELIVAALRDTDPIFRYCRIEAEESTGDLAAFPDESELVLALDPIDGTKQYRDKTGNGYAVMLHLRNATDVLYSLVYIPEKDEPGWWMEAHEGRIACGADDPTRPAVDAVRSLPTFDASTPRSNKIYVIGFQHREAEAARQITAAGLTGVASAVSPAAVIQRRDFPFQHKAAAATGHGVAMHSQQRGDLPAGLVLAHSVSITQEQHLRMSGLLRRRVAIPAQVIQPLPLFFRQKHRIQIRSRRCHPRASLLHGKVPAEGYHKHTDLDERNYKGGQSPLVKFTSRK